MRIKLLFILIFINSYVFAQEQTNYVNKSYKVENNTIQIDTISISPYYIKVLDSNYDLIKKENYTVNFAKATLTFINGRFNGKLINVHYKKFPEFLTKTYKIYDESLIVDNSNKSNRRFYQIKDESLNEPETLFNGLETKGFISRGITAGNNQDGVVNSGLKLMLTGKLSQKVSINANITDNNIPLQNNGYTQRLNEYDRIFIEMFSNKWKLTAGDLFLNNVNSKYLNFNKKVKGLSLDINLKGKKSKTNIFSSGALVEGKYKKVDFNGQEGNQGPYRLASTTNQYLLIISDSETVYINGIPLTKDDYTLDYSSAEITFKTTYPINSDMRIYVEFQASDQSYTRFVTFNKVNHQTDKLNIEVDFYSENDSKSKNLQQDLNDYQKEILFNAGDDNDQMYVLSAIREEYIENKIQYKKELINGVEAFIFSNTSTDELYSVRFTYVGNNNGNYIIDDTVATGNIFKYVEEIGGIKQGNYEPKSQIKAPNKLQITSVKANYHNKKTVVDTEFAYSDNDLNLFSSIDDNNNQGFSGNINWNQLLIDKKWKLSSNISYENINKDFKSIERLKNIEFNRDWNIKEGNNTNQELLMASLDYKNDSIGLITYQLENLNYENKFNGIKHKLNSNLKFNRTEIIADVSLMKSKSEIEDSNFTTIFSDVKHNFSKFLVGVKLETESNLRINNTTTKLNEFSFKNQDYGAYFSIKDSVRTRLEVGYNYRLNDSVQSFDLVNVNKSNNIYLKSNVIKKKQTNLDIYFNYRNFTNSHFINDKSLNSRVDYKQYLLDDFIQINSVYESSSGTIPQQEFNYIEVDSGKGFYTWIDYNNDDIQDLDEFEIAQFQDEATYIRVLLPSTKFIRTNQTKFNNSIILNPSKKNSKGFISHFINQTNISIDNKQLKVNDFNFNPFEADNSLELHYNFKNFLYFNRGKQHYSFTYSYLKLDNKTIFITGLQENNIVSNQLQFVHKIHKTWLIDIQGVNSNTINDNERYSSRNLNLDVNTLNAKLSYLFNDAKSNLSLLYKYNFKENASINMETLKSNNFGFSIQHVGSKKFSILSSFNYINNLFSESQNSAISYQLMEGLQNGKNLTWSVILQKSLTKYLDFNFNYNARKSESQKTIHTGTLQLRAKF